MFDFMRCRRADGSHYGTAGICRKGSEDPLSDIISAVRSKSQVIPQLSAKNKIGSGADATAYDIGNNVVVKIGKVTNEEIKALDLLKNVAEVPRMVAHEISGEQGGKSVLAMSKVAGIPLARANKTDRAEAYDKLILPVLFKLHSKGVTHNDLHGGNMFLTKDKDGKPSINIIDFGKATINKPLHQISDLWTVAYGGSRSNGKRIESIIDHHVQYDEDGEIQVESVAQSQRAVRNIWKDLGYG